MSEIEVSLSPAWRRILVVCSIAALVWVVAARMVGPSDAWDQTQPRTIAYTTDIIVNGHWLLPEERGELKATKPPLYNWLAVPVVKVMGFSSELAHKSPSVVAMVLCWLVLLRWGPGLIGAGRASGAGFLAGMMLVANYTIFKLGYLARPDMVLTLWLLLGWIAGTLLLIDGGRDTDRMPVGRRRWLALGFWICAGLAWITKGPAVLTLMVYVVVASRLVAGRWRALHALEWWWGLPLSLLMFAAWIWGVWSIDPAHLTGQLWANEIVGRFTGLGPEGSQEGPIGFLRTMPDMILYYLGRSVPWSILSLLGVWVLWTRNSQTNRRRWRELGDPGRVLHGGAIFIIVTIALYTISASKRADYIAAAYPVGALLATWWLLCVGRPLGVRFPWLAPVGAAVVLTGLTIYNELETTAPQRGFGDGINAFVKEAEGHLATTPMPIVCWNGGGHVKSYLGHAGAVGDETLRGMVATGQPFWLLAGQRFSPPYNVKRWLTEEGLELELSEECRSLRVKGTAYWPVEVVLYRALPRK